MQCLHGNGVVRQIDLVFFSLMYRQNMAKHPSFCGKSESDISTSCITVTVDHQYSTIFVMQDKQYH